MHEVMVITSINGMSDFAHCNALNDTVWVRSQVKCLAISSKQSLALYSFLFSHLKKKKNKN
jgi:hypothetical protein